MVFKTSDDFWRDSMRALERHVTNIAANAADVIFATYVERANCNTMSSGMVKTADR